MKHSDEIIIAALLENPTIRAASKACGVPERTIYTKLKNPAFKGKYEQTRRDLLEGATRALQSRLSDAIGVMVQICNDQAAAPQVRLNAADSIIRHSVKMTEQTDIISKLEQLEEWRREASEY